jgi:hypothetical protein
MADQAESLRPGVALAVAAGLACLSVLPLLGLTTGCSQSSSFGDESLTAVAAEPADTATSTLLVSGSSRNSLPLIAMPVDTSELRALEARTLPQTLVNGPHQFTSLPEYYWGANPQLLGRINRAKHAFDCVPPPTYHALTLVAGTAGVGKTFIKSTVFGKEHPPSALCKFDVRELYLSWKDEGVVVDAADMSDGDLVLNTLPSVSDKSRPRFREYLEASDANFYIIDSLDEVHPDDYLWILRQIHDFVSSPERRFVHVVVFGRPYAFRDYWRTASSRAARLDERLFVLAPPEFYTTGDLNVSSWNYQCWANKLTWRLAGGEPDSMPLDAYLRWAERDFPTTGEFASVASEDDSSRRAVVDATLNAWAAEFPAVCSMLRNLAGNSMVREIVERTVEVGAGYDERQVMEQYLHAWLARETEADNRPSVDSPTHLELYLKILEQIAVSPVVRDEVDDWGYFPVRDEDYVSVQHSGKTYSFSVRRVLNHSGLADVECRGAGVTRVRFEPAWMHRLLVEMHNDRVDGKPSYARLISQSAE